MDQKGTIGGEGGGIAAYLIIRIIRQEKIFLLISIFSLHAFGCYINEKQVTSYLQKTLN